MDCNSTFKSTHNEVFLLYSEIYEFYNLHPHLFEFVKESNKEKSNIESKEQNIICDTSKSYLIDLQNELKSFKRSRNLVATGATWRLIIEQIIKYLDELNTAKERNLVRPKEVELLNKTFQKYLRQVQLAKQQCEFEMLEQDDIYLEVILNKYLAQPSQANMSFSQFKLFAQALHDIDLVVSLIVTNYNNEFAEFERAYYQLLHILNLDKWQEFAHEWNWDFKLFLHKLSKNECNTLLTENQLKSCFLTNLIKLVLNSLLNTQSNNLKVYLRQYQGTCEDLYKSCNYHPVIVTVTGTNGKGTICNLVSYLSQQVHHILFTSPHILDYHERFKIVEPLNSNELGTGAVSSGTQQRFVSSQELCCAQLHLALVANVLKQLFARFNCLIDTTKSPYCALVPKYEENLDLEKDADVCFLNLGYFGQAVMSLHYLMYRKQVPLLIQEVGIGGKLDPTNLLDADIAILTNITHDHHNLLGDSLLSILDNKVRIARPNKNLYYADPQLGLIEELGYYQEQLGFTLQHLQTNNGLNNQEGSVETAYKVWDELQNLLHRSGIQENISKERTAFTHPKLFGRNTLCNWLTTTLLLKTEAQIQLAQNNKVFHGVDWQEIARNNLFVFDVAHNEGSMQELADFLFKKLADKHSISNYEIVVGMGAEKDLLGSLQVFASKHHCRIHLADFKRGMRGVSHDQTQDNVKKLAREFDIAVDYFEIDSLLDLVLESRTNKRVWVFCGSFYYLANLLERWHLYPQLVAEIS